MMESKAIDPQMRAVFPGIERRILSGVHDKPTAVWLDRKTSVRDRAPPACGGQRPAKSIKMRLHEPAAAVSGATADQAEKHLIRSGRQSSQVGHVAHVFHE